MTGRPRAVRWATLAALALAAGAAAAATPAPPELPARAWLLLEPQTGAVLAARDADRRLPPASLTKLMTAYVLFGDLRAGRLTLDETAVVSERAAGQPGARMFLRAGERVRVEDLIKGMLVQSGNDATLALVEHVDRKPSRFVARMNTAAAALQLIDTRYTNVSGLQHRDHYSSARDLARLAGALHREFPQYTEWFALRDFTWAGVRQPNRNPLLRLPYVDGLKTGHTGVAGYCLVASGGRDGLQLIAAVLGSDNEHARAHAGRTLLDYGFEHFATRRVHAAGALLLRARVVEGARPAVAAGVGADLLVTLARDEFARLRSTAIVPKPLRAPLARGAVLGELRVSLGTTPLTSVPLVALEDLPAGGLVRRAIDRMRQRFGGDAEAHAAP